MSEVKLTKNALREEETRLTQLKRYLPTLQLKKAMLQSEVLEARLEIDRLNQLLESEKKNSEGWSALLPEVSQIDPADCAKVESVKKRYENVAGVEVPYFEGLEFLPIDYTFLDTPAWLDGVIRGVQGLVKIVVETSVAEEKKQALEKELREVSIRVNLFEKILIPRAKKNIKKIKVFLGDQQLAAVSQAKVAKGKIELNNLKRLNSQGLKKGDPLCASM